MSDYKDFLLYGSLESSDSDDSDYSPSSRLKKVVMVV